MHQKITQADILNREIISLENDSSFCNDADLNLLNLKIENAEKSFSLLCTPTQDSKNLTEVLNVHEDLSKELECVICLEVPLSNSQVFSCSEHHLLCSECKNNPSVLSCPICRQNFNSSPATRNRLAEKMIQTLK